ncbi:MAG: VOC family protein [Saprospiraceae bacterium]|nr:VOC family protein [Saprospiraceae bacterium]
MPYVSSQKITPFLWFDGQAEAAINLYTSIFPNSEIISLKKWGEGSEFPADWVMTGTMSLCGLQLYAFDGGPMFKFTEAISLFVMCKDQAEIDFYWEKLTENGGSETQCGWLKDKFGLTWQIVPAMLGEKISSGEPARIAQMFQTMYTMKKLDIAALEAAYNA